MRMAASEHPHILRLSVTTECEAYSRMQVEVPGAHVTRYRGHFITPGRRQLTFNFANS